jgi:uncharacterized protein YndB with AHSA1/START domain
MTVPDGGVWRAITHGSDGTGYPNKMVFSKVVPNERLEYAHGGDDDADHVHFHTVVTFDALDDNKTRVTMRAIFATVDERNQTAEEYGAIEGGKQTLDRLAEHLVTMASGVDR